MLIDVHGRPLAGKREKVFTNPDIARYVSIADTPFRVLELTVVCLHCGATPKMANHPSDGTWFMECSCLKRVLKNPDTVSPRSN